ncbi:MarR family transcriptional regulator [Aneurinibacillus sp. BA2021]|nr:MarR family transcriptional regulator [Aneurinibacillus sp. BA2021]
MAVTHRVATGTSEAEELLLDLVNAYEQAFDRAAESVGLSAAQACVLGRLSRSRSMGGLAVELECDASNITQIVRRLDGAGLTYREAAAEDKRVRMVARTPKGDALDRDFGHAFTFAREALARLSDEEQDLLTALLRKALPPAGDPSVFS